MTNLSPLQFTLLGHGATLPTALNQSTHWEQNSMPAWSEYKEAAQQRGSLACEMYAIISTPVQPEKLQENLPAHLAYQGKMEQEGILVMAGPLSDLSGEQMEGVGMIIYRAESLEAATAIADADPMHQTGTREYTIRRWLVNEGSFQMNIKLSAQSITI